MNFDWRNGFSAATGSIITIRQFAAERMQQTPWLSRCGKWDVILGASGVLAFTLYYRLRHRERPLLLLERYHCLMLSTRIISQGVYLPIRMLLRGLDGVHLIISMLSRGLVDLYLIIPDNVRYYARVYGGFLATSFLIYFQCISIHKWRIEGTKLAADLVHVAYLSTVFLEQVLFAPSRRCKLEPREYLVRDFLSGMNVLGMAISFRPNMWERIYLLFNTSSIAALSIRYFDMMDPPNLIDERQNEGIPPL